MIIHLHSCGMLLAASIIFFFIETNELQFTTALRPTIHVKPDFDINLFTGIWYQQAKFGPMLFGGLDQCGLLQFMYNPKNKRIALNYTSTSLLDQKQIHYAGKATYQSSNKKDGILDISWNYDPEYKQEATTKLYIVDTNYDDYAVIAASKGNNSGWVMTRERNLPLAKNAPDIIKEIIKAMHMVDNVVEEDVFLDAQINCDTPKFELPTNILFSDKVH